DSCNFAQTCTATFTVTAYTPPTVTCATNTTVAKCQSQATVNSLFATWLNGFSVSGGCAPVASNGNATAPNKCGGSTVVTYTVTDSCNFAQTCTATFTVTAYTPPTVTCATNSTVAKCQSQASVNAAFASWLTGFSVSGGCNPQASNGNPTAPNKCGGSTVVTYTVTDSCNFAQTCTATFTVTAYTPPTVTCATNSTVAKCQS